jgi:hypothetical protein
MNKIKEDLRPLGSPQSWARTYGTYIAGQAAIDGVDVTAQAMERRWGCDRLRLLVDTPLREKFDRQRLLWNRAVWHGDLVELQKQAERMTKAWQVLDGAAEAAGAPELAPEVLELGMPDGVVVALVPDRAYAQRVQAEGRAVILWTHDELVKILENYLEVNDVKLTWPGATVSAVRREITDPLLNVIDSDVELDDEFGTRLSSFGA